MRLLTLTLLTVWNTTALAGVNPSQDPETGLLTWETESEGVQVRLTQISPDQARAFYQARGFLPEVAEHYVRECVFMTVVRNMSATPIEHRLADWRYASAGQPSRSITSKTQWEQLWKRQGVAEAARIAFGLAQFPATQTFAPDDWNQGMTSYRVPDGGTFTLHYTWRAGGKLHTGTLDQIRCAQ